MRIDDVVKEDVFVMKIDVEGSEVKALQSASDLIQRKAVSHIFLEWDKVKDLPEAVQVVFS